MKENAHILKEIMASTIRSIDYVNSGKASYDGRQKWTGMKDFNQEGGKENLVSLRAE